MLENIKNSIILKGKEAFSMQNWRVEWWIADNPFFPFLPNGLQVKTLVAGLVEQGKLSKESSFRGEEAAHISI